MNKCRLAFLASNDPSSLTSGRRTSVGLCACSIRMSLSDINSSDFYSFKNRGWYKGFTLLEVLTATAILTVACIFVLKISTQILDTWPRASRTVESTTEASLALDIMEEDLETAFPCFWIYNGLRDEKVNEGIRLCFWRQNREGGWDGVAYQVGYNETQRRHGLYRYVEVGEKEAIKGLQDIEEPKHLKGISSKRIILPSNLLAKNIREFSVKFLYKYNSGKRAWTSTAPFMGTPICAEVAIKTTDGEELARRVAFIVNSTCVFH